MADAIPLAAPIRDPVTTDDGKKILRPELLVVLDGALQLRVTADDGLVVPLERLPFQPLSWPLAFPLSALQPALRRPGRDRRGQSLRSAWWTRR